MIWYCPTKDDVVGLYEKAEMPLDEDLLSALADVDNELKKNGLRRSFVVIDGQCRICNYKQVCIVPEVADLDNLECGNCENTAIMEREIPDWEQE